MEGGCSIPVFALAQMEGSTYTLVGGIVSLDGSEYLRKEITFTSADAETRGIELADALLKEGADKILKEIKQTLGNK
jgi:hydroxymethylbilane synthase